MSRIEASEMGGFVRLWLGEGSSVSAEAGGRVRVECVDPIGLWEALTDALADEHADHLYDYVNGTGRPAEDVEGAVKPLPLHRTEAGYPHCSTCDGGGCLDCTDPA